MSEKQRIDGGYYLYQAELKKKKENDLRKDETVYSKLGAMFSVDQVMGTTNSSSDSDVAVNIHNEK